jgi:hypothetical protein
VLFGVAAESGEVEFDALAVDDAGDVGGELRVGHQLVQSLIPAGEDGSVWLAGLMVSHGFSSSAVSRFHWSTSGSARAATPS